MNVLRYHEAVLRMLEQRKEFDWEKAKLRLQGHEAWIKTLCYIHVPDMLGYNADRYYCKLHCCGLLQRSLQLYMQTAATKTAGFKGQASQKAAWNILAKVIAVAELIRSLEAIYMHFDTINKRSIEQ